MLLSACSSPDYPPWDGEVVIYFTEPDGAYETLEVVSTKGSSGEPFSYLISDLQEKAAKIGANAIIVRSPLETKKEGVAEKGENTKTETHLQATAIRIK